MRTLPPGTAIGPYVLEAEVARGGMGAVYRARREHDGAVVALKLLHVSAETTPEHRERFRREAQLAAGLVHPGIVRVHDAGEAGPLSYIAMDLIEGEPLSARVGRLAPLEAASLVAQVARAVEHAHARGVIHRDLKPSNVLLRRDDGRALVTDFGVARHVESAALTRTGALVGTPTYLSPEQAGGLPASPASDVHALGAVLFEALTGLPPFRHDDLASLLVAICTERPEPPSALTPGTPRALNDLCLAALAKGPAARPTAGDLAAGLEAIAAGLRPAGRGDATPLVVGAAGAVALLAIVFLLVTRAETGSPPVTTPARASEPPPATPSTTAPRSTQVEDPIWASALAARGDDESLLAAHDALDALEPSGALFARTRARLLEVAADLDRRWTAPPRDDPEFAAAADRLVLIHWLWLRLEPAHVVPSAVRGLGVQLFGTYLGMDVNGVSGERLLAMGRAGVAIAPRELNAYLVVARVAPRPGAPHLCGPILRSGLALAVELDVPFAWADLARAHARWLSERARTAGGEDALAARRELVELARAAGARDDLPPVPRRAVLNVAAPHAADLDEGLALVARAEALGRPLAETLLARARVLFVHAAGDPVRLERAAEQAADAGEQARAERDRAAAVEAFTFAGEVRLSREEQGLAVAAFERALTLDPRRPGLALRRVLLLEGGDPTTLEVAIADLVTRAKRSLAQASATPRGQPGRVALLEAFVAEAKAAAVAGPAEARARLRAWEGRLAALDGAE